MRNKLFKNKIFSVIMIAVIFAISFPLISILGNSETNIKEKEYKVTALGMKGDYKIKARSTDDENLISGAKDAFAKNDIKYKEIINLIDMKLEKGEIDKIDVPEEVYENEGTEVIEQKAIITIKDLEIDKKENTAMYSLKQVENEYELEHILYYYDEDMNLT